MLKPTKEVREDNKNKHDAEQYHSLLIFSCPTGPGQAGVLFYQEKSTEEIKYPSTPRKTVTTGIIYPKHKTVLHAN